MSREKPHLADIYEDLKDELTEHMSTGGGLLAAAELHSRRKGERETAGTFYLQICQSVLPSYG